MRFEYRHNTQASASPVHVGSGIVGERILSLPYAADVHVSAGLSAAFRVDPELRDEITLRIRTDDNLLEYVRAELRDGVIQIELEPGVYVDPSELRVTGTLGPVRKLEVSGVASVQVTNLLEQRIALTASGASRVSLSGYADALDLRCDGTARVHASMPNFLVQRARVALEGISHAEVCAQAGVSGRVRFPAQLSVAGGAVCEIEGAYRRV